MNLNSFKTGWSMRFWICGRGTFRLFQRICITILFAIIGVSAIAEGFRFRHYRVEDGLSFNTVRCILQDKKGFVWFGTEYGLNRFDGRNFKSFKEDANPGSLPTSYISALFEDSRGELWIGTDIGVFKYSSKLDSFYEVKAKAADGTYINTTVNNIVEDRDGNIWFSTYGQGAFCYNPSKDAMIRYKQLKSGANPVQCLNINFVYVDKGGTIWLAPKTPTSPLAYFDRSCRCFKIFPFTPDTKGIESLSIYCIFEDSYRNFWLGTWNTGLCKLNRKTGDMQIYLSPKNTGGVEHVHDINEYRPGELFVASDNGLSHFNTKTGNQKLYTSTETDLTALSDKFIYPIYKDREGGFWIGTYYGGINYLAPSNGFFERFKHSDYINSVSGNVIGVFTEDKDGNIWVGSDDGGVCRYTPSTGQFKSFSNGHTSNSLSGLNTHAFCWDGDNLWIGTYARGLNVLNTKTGAVKNYMNDPANPSTLDGSSLYAIFKDSKSNIWVTSMSGVNLYNRASDSFIRIKNLDANTVDIKEDNRGKIWFGTSGKGLFCFDYSRKRWTNFMPKAGDSTSVLSNQINCMTIDSQHRLWIGTSKGLCLYDSRNNSFQKVELDIPSNSICSIIEHDNILWITTSKGLVRYDLFNKSFRLFTQADGLISDQFIYNSGFKSSAGKIYFGTASGFCAFDPRKITPSKYLPNVAFTGLEIFNKEVSVTKRGPLREAIANADEINLSYKDNVFSICFAALSYITPEKNRYAYILEGFDKSWNYVNNQNKATYTNLPYGTYYFKVKASNSDGLWNEEGATLKVVIHPPFWLSIGFKIIYLILLVSAIIYLLKMQHKRTENRHAERMRKLSQEKEKELYDAKIQFFTMIAHEIRTPVSLIIGPLEKIMEEQQELPKAVVTDLGIIDRNSQVLLQLVNQLLDFRKIEQGVFKVSKKNSDVNELVQSIYDRFMPLAANNGIRINLLCTENVLNVDIDRDIVNKVVSNLLSNAVKYAEKRIDVKVSKSDDSQYFTIEVTDDGEGITDENKQKIFQPFYQVDAAAKPGTGLGLSIARSLVEAHGGRIEVENNSPKGTLFRACFLTESSVETKGSTLEDDIACTESAPEKGAKRPVLPIGNTENRMTLLIVEDNVEMRHFLANSLTNDYKVITAVNGMDGIEKLKKHEISLVITDLMMPKMDGMALCEAIRGNVHWSSIPIILLTAKTDVKTKVDSLNLGVDAYLEKPFSMVFLKAQVKNLIETRSNLKKQFSNMPFVPLTSIAASKADEEFLKRMNTIIEKNISNFSFTIENLADELNISRSGLFAKVKLLAEVTPNDLIQIIRLKKGAELLAQNKYRISEVAYMVGFNNPSYFTKCFQKQFGIRPGEFIGKK